MGNVAEYNAASLRSFDGRPTARIRACDEYGSMAPFYAADPGVVVVAGAHQGDLDLWAEVQAPAMGWDSYRPVAWQGDSLVLSEGLTGLRPVTDAIDRGATVVPWGETPELRAFVQATAADAGLSSDADVVGWLDSKASAADVFHRAHAAIGRPDGFTIPRQWVAETEGSLVATLVTAGAAGRPVMVKSHVGVGGTGCHRVAAAAIATQEAAATTVELIRSEDPFVFACPVIVQVCYQRAATDGDLTADLLIDQDGAVHFRGAARMLVAGTHYEGCVTLDDHDPLPSAIRSFSMAVGDLASDRGYRGWLDVDFVRSPQDGLVPLEVNARRTGPTVPMVIRETWSRRVAEPVHVAAHDLLRLDRSLSAAEAIDRYRKVVADTGLDGSIVPTLVSAVSSPAPYLGVAARGTTSAEASARLDLFAARLNAGG